MKVVRLKCGRGSSTRNWSRRLNIEELQDKERRRRRRCFHRAISGLEKGGSLRLVTLTSSDAAVKDIQHSFRRLIARLRRRRLVDDYLKVIEVKDSGRQHIHLCFRGSYIEQQFLSHLWKEIHHSPIVDIRKVRLAATDKRNVANYLAKYMSKALFRRYSWSWGWVYKGFVNVWRHAIHLLNLAPIYTDSKPNFFNLLRLWKAHLKNHSPPQTFIATLHALLHLSWYEPIPILA